MRAGAGTVCSSVMRAARYLEDHGDRIVLRPCAEDALARGGQLAFIAAPLVIVTASVAAWIVADGDGLAFLAGWSTGALVAGILALIGIVKMVGARRGAERGAVRIDLAERIVERPGRPLEVLRGVTVVRVRARRALRFALELVHDDGHLSELITAPRAQGRALTDAAEHLADALGVSAEAPRSARKARPLVPRDPRIAAALCNVPIDGFFVAACVWFLMTSTDPFVRFHAKQSLALFGLSAITALLMMGCCSAPFALLVPDDFGVSAFVCPLVAFAGARVVVRTVAAMRAHRGIVWIQPWLAPLARRWAPR